MISGTLKLLALGIAAFIVSLVVAMPAQFADRYLPPDIRATGLRGTVWQGEASRLRVRGFDLGQVSWEMRPLFLLVGRLASDVSVNRADLQGRGTIGIGLQSVRLTNTNMVGRAALLKPFLSDYGVDIDGRLEADIEALQLNDSGPQALDGTIVWHEARLIKPAALKLGDVNIALTQNGDTALADLKNTGDTLRVTGNGQLHEGWKYDAQLHIVPTPTTPKQVRDTLPLLAKPDSSGAITLSQQGTLAATAASTQ